MSLNGQSTEEIIADFEELFGQAKTDDAEESSVSTADTTEEDDVNVETEEEEEARASEEEQKEEDSNSSESEEDSEAEAKVLEEKNKAKQNHAFAELRNKNKKQENLIRRLGAAVGLEDGTELNVIIDNLENYVLERESKTAHIPVDTLKRIQELEQLVGENNRIKLESEVQNAFISLSEKFGLGQDELLAFVDELKANNKNPLEVEGVDIELEYIRTHQEAIIQNAVNKALEDERKRKEKVKNHSSEGVPSNGDSTSDDKKLSTVSDLDAFLDSQMAK